MPTCAELICPGCEKPFIIDGRSASNRKYCSKSCQQKALRKAYSNDPKRREQWRQWDRARHKRDRDKRAAHNKAWRAENPEKDKAAHKAWYEKNRDSVLAKMREYNASRRELASQRMKQQRIDSPWKGMIQAAKSRAKRSKIPFSLTFEWARERWTGYCEVTGLPFKLGLSGNGPQGWSPSLDRIKPNLGYTPDNCRFVLWWVNVFKSNMSDDEMFERSDYISKSPLRSKT